MLQKALSPLRFKAFFLLFLCFPEFSGQLSAKVSQKFPKGSNMAKPLADDFRDNGWPRGLYRRNQSYRYRRLYNGQKINKTFGDVSERQAIERAEQLNLQLGAGVDVGKQLRQSSLACREFIEEHLKQKAAGWAPRSFARYRAAYANFLSFLGTRSHALPLAGIDYATASAYMTARSSVPIMPNGSKKLTAAQRTGAKLKTLLFELEALRSLFREARKRGLVDVNPFEQIKIKRPSREQVAAGHRILNEKEVQALLIGHQHLIHADLLPCHPGAIERFHASMDRPAELQA
jgi:hypothetical protein